MKRLIAAMSLAAFALSAFASETYGPPEVNNTERALPEVAQTEPSKQAELDSAKAEETESAATGDSTQSDG